MEERTSNGITRNTQQIYFIPFTATAKYACYSTSKVDQEGSPQIFDLNRIFYSYYTVSHIIFRVLTYSNVEIKRFSGITTPAAGERREGWG